CARGLPTVFGMVITELW
nr:immunoglobulin heavy chain junction region [Macaca mulatta]MOX62552.1 immunoglobulin heavy chain junction region [Macaca mulatta]MOX65714.1 immunoglobulin heavy chain junction region [Macaca mulatta]MOX66993.1 immunoglobulin heavy chain junction region [Macaca mulatta]MOX68375.1 immunoglobulin heavy chain junction region [Macaca mulatta]